MPAGRPKKEIDKKQFENLCALQCTEVEFCGWFDVCEDTLNSWCKANYQDENGKPLNFSEVFALKRGQGKISLRRAQFQLAQKNASMAIFLGKNYLGQSDTMVVSRDEKAEDDALTKSLKELAEELNDADQ